MSETTEQTEPQTEAPEQQDAPQSDSEDAPLGEGGKKALESERTARKEAERLNAELRKQLDQIEGEKLSDLEKAQKAAKDAEERATLASLEAQRLRLATKYRLTEDEADDLPDDPEKAERIAQRFADSRKADLPGPDPTQGGTGAGHAKSKGDQFADFANNFFSR